jgi:hypothetical protein
VPVVAIPGVSFQSRLDGVDQVASAAVFRSLFHPLRAASFSAPSSDLTDLLASFAPAVGHEVKPLPDVRRPDARSAQICSPDAISQSFQVSANSGEPVPASAACNLFAKND